MPWECFRVGLYTLLRRIEGFEFSPTVIVIYDLFSIRRSKLFKLLKRLSSAECMDPRDKVYGILGLIDERTTRFTSLIEPDYGISVQKLYILVCKILIVNTGLFSALRYTYRGIDSHDLPSWVPDWRKPPLTRGTLPAQYADLKMHCSDLDIRGSTLSLKGVCVASIRKVEAFDTSDSSIEGIYENINRVIASFAVHKTEAERRKTITDLVRSIQNDVTYHDFNIYADGFQTTIALQEAVDLMADFLNNSSKASERISFLTENAPLTKRFRHAWSLMEVFCSDRAVFLMDTGNIALGPDMTESGDILVVVHGCSLPLVFRSHDEECYTLIGPAFTPDFVHGEALVGSLPYPWDFVKYFGKGTKSWRPRFRNQLTKQITALDPRIDWSQLEVEEGDPQAERDLTEEYGRPLRRPDEKYLRKNHPDLKIETFKLI